MDSLESFSRNDERTQERKRSSKDGAVVHGLHHYNWKTEVIRGVCGTRQAFLMS